MVRLRADHPQPGHMYPHPRVAVSARRPSRPGADRGRIGCECGRRAAAGDGRPRRTGQAGGVVKGYLLDSFKDAFDRYLPPLSATPLQGP